MKALFSVLFFVVFVSVQAQFNVSGRVLDADSGVPMSFVAVAVKGTNLGTITNDQGYFLLNDLREGQVIVVSNLGYITQEVVVKVTSPELVIRLKIHVRTLSEAAVFSDDSFVYDKLAAVSSHQHDQELTTKTYFEVESFYNDDQIELVEGYYNGRFRGLELEGLNYKTGRIGLKPFDDRVFTSTENSRVFSMHRLFSSNTYFPVSPFELSRRKLKKMYRCTWGGEYLNEEGERIAEISFAPKVDDGSAFSGKVILRSSDNMPLLVELEMDSATLYPFVPAGNTSGFKRVDLRVSKSFEEVNGSPFLKSVNFDITLDFKSERGKGYAIRSSAILYSYDWQEAFVEPYFTFYDGMYVDYRMINASPSAHFFWNSPARFRLNDSDLSNERFFNEHASYTSENLFVENGIRDKGIFESNYIIWSENRVRFKQKEPVREESFAGVPLSQRYQLDAQIFLDVYNEDHLLWISHTVFDPYTSFFLFNDSPGGLCFMNLYFDLMEVQRRKMEDQLRQGEMTFQRIAEIYEEHQRKCEEVQRDFYKDAQHGTNVEGMRKWNDIVRDRLGVDNFAIFEITSN